jgi:hypothetical protein
MSEQTYTFISLAIVCVGPVGASFLYQGFTLARDFRNALRNGSSVREAWNVCNRS